LTSEIDPPPPSSKLFSGQPKPDDLSESAIISLHTTLNLMDTSFPLFERYRVTFALRNIGTPAAVDALASGFSNDSALLKHKIAFVFGQLLSAHSVPSLLKVLKDGSFARATPMSVSL
ncbi:uncharacterized protein EDB91DRAFT_1048501, partial [Suillus paluster]|uniref:uncharacterized protein n=1 Tax=Suillus paluster TaxID=48578 RepID=UPI001B868A5F